jgi:hypothetical protein
VVVAVFFLLAALVLSPLLVIQLLTFPRRRRRNQRPFDPGGWKRIPGGPGKNDQIPPARLWMTDDLIRRLPGRSRDEVVEVLGDPWRLHERGVCSDETGQHVKCDMAYELGSTQYFIFYNKRYVLAIQLDGQSRVAKAFLGTQDIVG